MGLKNNFSYEDDQLFKKSTEFSDPVYLRRIFVLFILLYGLFGITDWVYFPESFKMLLFIRFGIVIPILLSTILLTYSKYYYQYHQPVIAISFFIGGLGIAYMLILKPENIVYYGGLFMVLFSGFLLIKLRYLTATITGWSIFLFYLFSSFITNNTFSETVLYSFVFFIGANLIGMAGAYQIEKMNRTQFLHDKLITQVHDSLKSEYDEKSKQLIETNKEKQKLLEALTESNNRFKSLFEKAPLGYQSLDFNGHFREVNETWLNMLGYQKNEVIGKWFGDFLTPKYQEAFRQRFELFKERGKIHSEFEMLQKNGKVVFIEFEGLIGYNEDHQFEQTYCTLNEITERKLIEEKLRRNMNDLLKSQQIAHLGTWRLDVETNEVIWSEELYKMYGFDPKLPPPPYTEHMKLFTPDSWNQLSDALSRTTSMGIPYELELETVTKDGSNGWMWVRGEAEKNTAGEIIAISGAAQNITDRIQAQKLLQESEQRFKVLHNASFGGIALHDQGLIIECNQGLADITGYSIEELVGMDGLLLIAPNDRELVMNNIKAGYEKPYEAFGIRKNNEIYPLKLEARNLPYNGKQVRVVEFRDISELKKQENEKKKFQDDLIKSEEQYKLLTTQMDMGLALHEMIFDEKGNPIDYRFISVNDSFERLTGLKRDDLIGKTVLEVMPNTEKYWINTYGEVAKTGRAVRFENYAKTLNRYYSLSAYSPRIGQFAVIIDDITDRKQKQKEIEYLSEHDPLTNLYNRRYYFEEFKLLDQPQFYPLGMMMLDVNGLKLINDAFGHQVGDEALKVLGNILKEIFEEKDVIARIGGDEFAALIPNTTAEKLQKYKEKIVSIVKTKRIKNIELSLAVGYELKTNANYEIDEMQKHAENRMYAHKSTEGSSVRGKAINAILVTLTDKYDSERRHSKEVSYLCKQVGIELKLKDDELKGLEQAGLFHDIGKISIPDSILGKPGKLTDDEFDIIQSHTQVGYQILRAADVYSDLAIHALHHHERWDGLGYPSGLKGSDIPLFSRIICVVDAYEAMTADRPYRKKMSKEYAISEIVRCSGTQFDPKIAKLFVEKVIKA